MTSVQFYKAIKLKQQLNNRGCRLQLQCRQKLDSVHNNGSGENVTFNRPSWNAITDLDPH